VLEIFRGGYRIAEPAEHHRAEVVLSRSTLAQHLFGVGAELRPGAKILRPYGIGPLPGVA
jgi:hypothetical protein